MVYPIGDSSFESIRSGKMFYVDKTEYVYRLVTQGKYYFLSRPRRFGKSLLLSTLEAYFRGRKELFEGLAIAGLEKNWDSYPVLRLDLSLGSMTSADSLRSYLSHEFGEWEEEWGIEAASEILGLRFLNIIREIWSRSGKRVVVLIDEYDNPLFSTFDNSEPHKEIKKVLKEIYSILKGSTEELRFCMLTGITRFSKMSIFSGLNNLNDITLSPSYAGICGVTQQELETYCKEGLETVAQANALSHDEAVRLLKNRYDGYHFGSLSLDVYNPYSLIQTFPDGVFGSYWYMSGTSQFLWNQISKLSSEKALTDLFDAILTPLQLGATEEEGLSMAALLFQTGYLTLKEQLMEGRYYRLGIPNEEVREGIMEGLLPLISHRNTEEITTDLFRLRKYAGAGDVDAMLRYLQSFLAGVSNRLTMRKPEIYYENNLFLLFNLIGMKSQVEIDSADGRIDVVMEYGDYIYIMELKLDKPAEKALEQIKKKKYWQPYLRQDREIILVGISFSSETRNITEWESEKISDSHLIS